MLKQIAIAARYDISCAYQTKVQHVKAWADARIEEQLVLFTQWVFSKRAVQRAIAESITCSTPIGRMLNEHIESSMDEHSAEVDADNVRGLGSYIESSLEDFVRDNLEDAINEHLDYDKLSEAVVENPDFQEELAKIAVEASIKRMIELLQQ